tara:strand:+ start:1611 stop:2102 length:492 start_codon:yes stop_codon:yes gene_type:complete
MSKDTFKNKLRGYGGSLTLKLKKSLEERGHIAKGKLSKSIRSRVVDGKNGVSLQVEMLGYGNVLNKNIKPTSLPNIDAILSWMDAKGIRRNKSKGKFKSRKALALAIARSIQKNGFATVNKHSVGWMDIVINKEMERIKKNVKHDLRLEFRNMTLKLLNGKKD